MQIFFKNFKTLLINIYTNVIQNNGTIPVSDPLHLFKTFRERILDYPIQILPDGELIESDKIEAILNVGPPLCDKSHLSRMRDSFPLQSFTFTNIIKLIENNKGNTALIFFHTLV